MSIDLAHGARSNSGDARRLAMLVEYDGRAFHGFQAQRNACSVQAALEEAIRRLTGENPRVRGAGRTDAGVHALGQVVAFDTGSSHSPDVFRQALNHHLPNDVAILEVADVSCEFDPRRWAVGREYRYRVLNSPAPSPLLRGLVHHVRQPLDAEAMDRAASLLEGERDFAPFAASVPEGRAGTMRIVYRCSVTRRGELVILDMEANGFLRQQVRRTAGALLEVGLGRMDVEGFRMLAECGRLGAAEQSLPAAGLTLMRVNYPTPLFRSQDAANEREAELLEARAQ